MASDRLIDTSIQRMIAGDHMAIFPESERNKSEPEKIQKLKIGVGIIAGKVAAESQVGIVPVAMWYGDSRQNPVLHIGTPIQQQTYYPQELLPELQVHMQSALNTAIDRSSH